MEHLFIIFILVERQNGDAIVKLEAKRVNCIVNNDHIFQVPVLNYPQILYVNSFLSLHARVSVKSVLNEFMLRIEIVQHNIGI